MTEKISTINELGIKISQNMKDGCKLYELCNLLRNYNGTDWKKYEKFCDIKYKKNVVFSDDQIDIVVIGWNSKQQSGIHDHPENGCLLKILNGQLTEKIYIMKNDTFCLNQIKSVDSGQISYAQGKNGLHNISNDTDSKVTSLHIYCPPKYIPKYYNEQ